MIKIPFQVMGRKWNVILQDTKRFRKSQCDKTIAYTDGDEREIHVGTQGRDIETIRHELVHAYMAEFCLNSADLDNENLEEIYADFMAKRGHELLKLADVIFKRIKQVIK